MDNKRITIGEISEELRKATKAGKLERRYSTPLYTSLEKYYGMTSDGESLRDIYFDEDDFESRANKFYELNKGKYSNPNTVFAYKARAKRAVKIFRKLQKDGTPHEKAPEKEYITNLLLSWKKILQASFEDKQKSANTEVIICPTKGSGVAALVVSADSKAKDYEMEYEILSVLLGKKDKNADQ